MERKLHFLIGNLESIPLLRWITMDNDDFPLHMWLYPTIMFHIQCIDRIIIRIQIDDSQFSSNNKTMRHQNEITRGETLKSWHEMLKIEKRKMCECVCVSVWTLTDTFKLDGIINICRMVWRQSRTEADKSHDQLCSQCNDSTMSNRSEINHVPIRQHWFVPSSYEWINWGQSTNGNNRCVDWRSIEIQWLNKTNFYTLFWYMNVRYIYHRKPIGLKTFTNFNNF